MADDPYIPAEDIASLDITPRVTVPKHPVVDNPLCKVYRGSSDGKDVAVKRMQYLGASQDERKRRMHELLKELTVLCCAVHEFILPFLGTVRIEDDVCIVTEWAANGSLSEYLDKNDNSDRLQILLQVASGLHYLHTPNETKPMVVHGDLHIDNVLINSEGNAMICDFGLSKVVPDNHAASISVRLELVPRGRATYLAPELHEKGVVRSCSTDVFSFGVLCFHVYAGHAPFDDRNGGIQSVMVLMALKHRPERQDVTRADMSDELWELISQCWDHAPLSRPSMLVVRQRLASILDLRYQAELDRSIEVEPAQISTEVDGADSSTLGSLGSPDTLPSERDVKRSSAKSEPVLSTNTDGDNGVDRADSESVTPSPSALPRSSPSSQTSVTSRSLHSFRAEHSKERELPPSTPPVSPAPDTLIPPRQLMGLSVIPYSSQHDNTLTDEHDTQERELQDLPSTIPARATADPHEQAVPPSQPEASKSERSVENDLSTAKTPVTPPPSPSPPPTPPTPPSPPPPPTPPSPPTPPTHPHPPPPIPSPPPSPSPSPTPPTPPPTPPPPPPLSAPPPRPRCPSWLRWLCCCCAGSFDS